MALESFYGGKQGVSPVIKASFEYVSTEDLAYQAKINSETKLTKTEAYRLRAAGIKKDDNTLYNPGDSVTWTSELLVPLTMNECFKNVNYTDVWYNELCIIDTQNKLNPNNGKIFRRTLKRYQNPNVEGITDVDALYAEYIGQIVGPSGGIPNLDLGNLDAERKKAVGLIPTLKDDNLENMSSKDWDYAYPTEEKDESGNLTGNFVVTTENPVNASIDDNPETPQDESKEEAWTKIPTLKMNDGRNIEMVPGKVTDQNGNLIGYNDTIEYTWCNVRRNLNNSDEDSAWIYLGFKIPYVSYDVTWEEKLFTYSGPVFEDKSSTSSSLGGYHPFSKEYKFNIPRGARGIGPEKFFLVTPDNKDSILGTNTLYDFDAITYDPDQDKYSVNTSKTKTPTSLTYWVAMWTLYNPKTIVKNPVYQYLGDYKDIKSIRVITDPTDSNYGQMSIKYSNSNNWVNLNKLPLPKKIEYVENDTQDGTILKFTMADNSIIKADGTIREIKKIENDPAFPNKLLITYTTKVNGEPETQTIDMPVPSDVNVNDIEIDVNSSTYVANKTVFKEITLIDINDNDNIDDNDTPLIEFWLSTMSNN